MLIFWCILNWSPHCFIWLCSELVIPENGYVLNWSSLKMDVWDFATFLQKNFQSQSPSLQKIEDMTSYMKKKNLAKFILLLCLIFELTPLLPRCHTSSLSSLATSSWTPCQSTSSRRPPRAGGRCWWTWTQRRRTASAG